jgi:AbrB family looped-hinge helix DNA binding protein
MKDSRHQTLTTSLARVSEVILQSMTHRVGPKGQVVIPKKLRAELGIQPGDEVTFWLDDDHVAVRPASRRRPLKGRFSGADLTADLMRERAEDRRRDDRI